MPDEQEHAREGQIQRAKRLREQIEGLKSGRRGPAPGHEKSLREQVEERANQGRPADEVRRIVRARQKPRKCLA
jgi:hypothetical protein